jgi:hypothetical protein
LSSSPTTVFTLAARLLRPRLIVSTFLFVVLWGF